MTSPLLSVQNLSLAFGRDEALVRVVDGVSFQVGAGELVALVGESGSGKSLTALSLMGLQPPESYREAESIRFDERELASASESQMQHIRGRDVAMVFQEPMSALNPLHRIGRQLTESFAWHENPSPEALEARRAELLELVGLASLRDRMDAYPHHLSGGERQRVMIGMAMAASPKLLICDEPTTALDVTLQRQILRLLKDLQASHGMGILLITHDLPVVRKVADRVLVMHRGKIVEEGRTSVLFSAPLHPYTRELLNALPTSAPPAPPEDAPMLLETPGLSVAFPIKSAFLRRTIDEKRAVKHVALHLRRGETLGVVGESGSGKSSLGFGLLRLGPSSGEIRFQGERIDGVRPRDLKPLRQHMQIVFQDPFSSLNPRMSVGDTIAEGLRVHLEGALKGKARTHYINERVADMLSQVGLSPDMAGRYPHEFSGGQRQRIAIARAMILNPEFVVLDEPTSALDMAVQATILELLRDFQQRLGVSYLLISHDLRVIRALSHRVMVMRAGEIIEQGDTETLYTNPQTDYTRSLLDAVYGEGL